MQKVLSNKLFFGIMLMIVAFALPIIVMFGAKQSVFAAEENPIKVSIVNYQNSNDTITQSGTVNQGGFAVLNSFSELETKTEGTTTSYFNGYYQGSGTEKSKIYVQMDPSDKVSDETTGFDGYKITFAGEHGLAFFDETQNKWFWFPMTSDDPQTAYHQAINISIGNDGSSFNHLSVSVTLNGTKLYSAGISDSSGTKMTYNFVYHGLNSFIVENSYSKKDFFTYKDSQITPGESISNRGEKFKDVEGYYQISIEYRQTTSSSKLQQASFGFYLVTSNTYANNEDSVLFDYTQKKTLKSNEDTSEASDDTISVDAETFSKYSTYHYFNHTNFETTLRDGTTITKENVPNSLQFPTISFNPEKYSLGFSRVLYSLQEFGQFEFSSKSSSMYGTATLKTFDSNNSLISTQSKTIARKTSVLVLGTNEKYNLNGSILENIVVTKNPENNLARFDTTNNTYIVPATLDSNGVYYVTLNGTNYYYNTVLEQICVYELGASFSLEWTFEELGEYDFTKTFRLKIGDTGESTDYIEVDSDKLVSSIKNFIKNEILYLKGFQATYAKNGNSSAYLKNDTYKSDFTFMNPELSSNTVYVDTSLTPEDYKITISDGKFSLTTNTKQDPFKNPRTFNFVSSEIASTNQPPVQFRYSAELNKEAGSCWYVFQNSKGELSLGNYNFSTKFNDAGLYFVFVSFMPQSGMTATQQMLVFRITNTPPTVSIKTTSSDVATNDATVGEIGVAEFTNKKVFLTWEVSNVFNAQITATYTFKEFGSNTTTSSQTLKGFVYDALTKEYNTDATVFSKNGHYTVKIYYTNSGSSLTKTFTIDNQSISGIKALEVNANRTLTNANKPISSLENFNLATNKSFVWTWDKKASGAEITATYYQASLSDISDYSQPSIVFDSTEKQWILANGIFGLLKVGQNYAYTEVNETNQSTVKFASSQVISTNKLGLLLLQDEAGNTSVFVTILDKISPTQIQRTTAGTQSTSTLVSETTEFVWGTHKALEVETGTGENDDITDLLRDAICFNGIDFAIPTTIKTALSTTFAKNSENTFYYTQGINSMTIHIDDESGKTTPTTLTFSPSSTKNVFVVVEKRGTDSSTNYYTYLASSFNASTGTGSKLSNSPEIALLNGEDTSSGNSVLLSMTVQDKLENSNFGFTAQVSLDQSQGRMFSFSEKIDFDSDGSISNTINTDLKTANRLQIFNNYSTNRDFATFTFLQQTTGIFVVTKIVLDYYTLNYDKNSPNYPYSSSARQIVLWDESGHNEISWDNRTIGTNTYYMTSALMPSSNGLSQAGMYKITRYYGDSFNNASIEDRKGDTVRTYTMFVDRSGVISASNSTYNVGETIELVMGSDSDFYEDSQKIFKSFTNQNNAKNEFNTHFFADSKSSTTKTTYRMPTSPSVTTNLLPANVALAIIDDVAYKYVYKTDSGTYKRSTINKNAVLMVLVQQFDTAEPSNNGLIEQRIYTSALTEDNSANKIFAIKNLKNYLISTAGVYRVMIFDTSNISMNISGTFSWKTLEIYENSTFAPNCAIFSFKTKPEAPSVKAITKSSSGSGYTNVSTAKIQLENDSAETTYYYSGGENNVVLTFDDTSDDYRAKIAFGNRDLELTRTLRYLGSNGQVVFSSSTTIFLDGVRTYDKNNMDQMYEIFSQDEIARIEGNYTGTVTNMTLSSKNAFGGILYYREAIANTSERYVYYIILPSSPDGQNGFKVDQVFNLSFHYIGEQKFYGDCFSGNIRVYVDNTAPYQNLLNLINNDTYLSTQEKTAIINELANPNSDLLKNYAFAVGPSFYLKSQGQTESNSVFYYRYISAVYDSSIPQTVVPGSDAYSSTSSYKFSTSDTNYKRSGYYGTTDYQFPKENGYYDIIEYDKANNYRVYTIYLSSNGASLSAEASNEKTEKINYNFLASFSGDKANFIIQQDSQSTLVGEGIIDFSNADVIKKITLSNTSFKVKNFNINDAWFKISYRLLNNNTNTAFTTIAVAPDKAGSDTSTILSTLNTFIENCITSGKLGFGCKIEIVVNNRSGNDIHFFLNTPARALTLSDLNPEQKSKTQFAITLPADTYSMQYSNFAVTRNGSRNVEYDDSTQKKAISLANTNRSEAQTFLFNMSSGLKLYFTFVDNFGKEYLFIYPSTSGLVEELIFEEANPKTYNNIKYSPNTVKFNYTTGGTDRISIKITNADTNEVLVDLKKLPYRSSSVLVEGDAYDVTTASQKYSTYFSASVSGSNVVTLTFFALENSHLIYSINFVDVDNNSHDENFGIYTKAPTITLTDTSGIVIWSSATAEKVTSKTVVARWIEDSSLMFAPAVYLYDGSSLTKISPSHQISGEGNYELRIISTIGTISQKTLSFTIKPATDQIYSVYFNEDILNAHSEKYRYQTEEGNILMINQYFFLSNSSSAWADNIRILPNEAQDLKIDESPEINGNTRIYKISGKVYENYIAITQIYSSQNSKITSNFEVRTFSETNPTPSTAQNSQNDYAVVFSPSSDGDTYAQIYWETNYTDTSSGTVFEKFVYAEILYNDTINLGKFTSGTVNLTKSGKYTIQLLDIVGQKHRFGTAYTFTLTLLNNIIYYINGKSPIEHATFNSEVVVSLPNTLNYQWSTTGKITALRNNTNYTNFTTDGTTWTFKEAGFYKISLETKTTQTRNSESGSMIYAEINFTILDPNEARSNYDFAKISGYYAKTIQKQIFNSELSNILEEIKANYQKISADENLSKNTLTSLNKQNSTLIYDFLKPLYDANPTYFDATLEFYGIMTQNVLKDIVDALVLYAPQYIVSELGKVLQTKNIDDYVYYFEDVTEQVKNLFGTNNLQSFSLTTENIGIGKFLITIEAVDQTDGSLQTYSYFVWLNDKSPTINTSREFGSASTSSFTISYNPSILFEDVGNCYISINGTVMAVVNESVKDNNQIISLTAQTKPGTYFVQVYSQSGTLLSSQRITIDEPMNTATIILIVVGVVVAVGVIVTFVLLRTKMKVK